VILKKCVPLVKKSSKLKQIAIKWFQRIFSSFRGKDLYSKKETEILSFLARLILGLLCALSLPGAWRVFSAGLNLLAASPSVWPPFLYGLIPGAVFYLIVRRSRIVQVFETFEHELTHAIVALLFLRRIRNFTVTPDEGGSVQHTGGFGGSFGDEMIGLAPYYLPTFAFFSAFLYPFLTMSRRKSPRKKVVPVIFRRHPATSHGESSGRTFSCIAHGWADFPPRLLFHRA